MTATELLKKDKDQTIYCKKMNIHTPNCNNVVIEKWKKVNRIFKVTL